MHKYLKSVGFSKVIKRRQMEEIVYDVIENYDEKSAVENPPEGIFMEYRKYYGNDSGVSVCGQFDEDQKFHVEYYYPFFRGNVVTTQEKVTIERHTDKQSYVGACDDLRIGITMIFYLQNPAEYMLEQKKGALAAGNLPLILSGLARDGKILFPVQKDKEAVKVDREITNNRNHLLAAARNGDEEAMENLTMEDMDIYSMISQRIATEDVLSIVDSYFMPYGIECDQYNVLGEILDFRICHNQLTGEELVQMTVESNDMQYDVCINRADLLGEPAVGRRFKGTIWLQGQLNY
jgi:hypothetical protein